MKNKLLALAASLGSFAAFAEGETSTGSFAEVTTQMEALAGNLTDWVSSALPVILGIAAAFLAPWLFRKVVGWIKSMAKG